MQATIPNDNIPTELQQIFVRGKRDWNIHNHRYWPPLQTYIIANTSICDTQTTRTIAIFNFCQQVNILLLDLQISPMFLSDICSNFFKNCGLRRLKAFGSFVGYRLNRSQIYI